MMIDRSMITEPSMMFSEMFWSSSISLRTEKGISLQMAKKVSAKIATPASATASDRRHP